MDVLVMHHNYALRGGGNTTFWQYDLSGNSWTAKAATPATVSDGGGLAYEGTYLYALRGGNTTTFWQYNVLSNSWTAKASTPGAVSTGGGVTYAGSYIYALQGNNATGFYRYNRLTNAWSSMAATPATVGVGGIGGRRARERRKLHLRVPWGQHHHLLAVRDRDEHVECHGGGLVCNARMSMR